MKAREGSLFQEIRINPDYTHLGYAKYDKDRSDKKSETVIKNNFLLTSDFANKLSKNLNSVNTMFPPNCRYLEQTDKGTFVIIEEPPAVRTIRASIKMNYLLNKLKAEDKLEEYGLLDLYKSGRYGPSPHKFTLAFPYVIFMLFFNNYNEYTRGKVFLRTRQLSGFSDNLLRNPMLNINSDQSVCMGDYAHVKSDSLYSAVQNTVSVWWNASFNFDYKENYNRYKQTPIINNYLEWQYYSQYHPMFIFNTDWIPYEKNIYHVLEHMKQRMKTRPKVGVTYGDMVKIFTKPIETGETEKTSERSKREYNLFYDVSQSVYLNETIALNVGDPVVLKNGEVAYVYSFIGFMRGGNIKYVQLEKNGQYMMLKFGEPFKKFMIGQILKHRFAQKITLPNKTVIKPNDILVIKSGNNEVYKKVDYIRPGRIVGDETSFEVKCGNNYYLSHKLDAKVFSMEKPKIDGITIKKNENYFFFKESNSMNAMLPVSKVKFDEVNVTGDGHLYASFKNIGEGLKNEKHTAYFEKTNRLLPRIIKSKDCRPINGVFRVGRTIYYLKNGSKTMNAAWSYHGSLLYENYYSMQKPPLSMIKNLVKDDRFFISGPDFDTTFQIGDKVVVADWSKPIDVLNVKTLMGFKYDGDTGNILFVLQSKDNKLSEVAYVDGANGYVQTGYIRRVTNKFEKLEVGTKIIAKKAGICNFPKKDVNIIVAIIDDGPHEPLILCSNGCTLWYSTVMKDFQKVTMKAKKWKTLTHVPLDMSKIKFQAGDIINGRRDFKRRAGYAIFDPSTTRYLKVLPISYYPGYPEYQSFDRYFMSDAIFDSIPLPRISVAQQAKMPVIKAFIDFHGGIIKDPHNRTRLTFLDEGRINV